MAAITETARYEAAKRLVEREVIYCVSSLISTLAGREWDGSDGIDPDALQNLAYRQPDADDYREAARDVGLFDCPLGSPRADGRLITVQRERGDWFYYVTDTDGDEIDSGPGYDATEAGAWRAAFDSVAIDHPDGCEVYEHWIVSTFLAERLREKGETVEDDIAGLTVWGRCTSGQAISMDHVIQEIAVATYLS